MGSSTRISIVTSSFNQGRFIARTIESVLAQHYPDVEHIVVDGMSTDETPDILARFPHLTVIREPDRGQADAINKGFRRATGEIFGFLNSDDTLEPGALQAVAEIVNSAAGRHIVMGRCRFVDEDDRFLGIEHPSAFESHRRVLEIWKGHCLPQPAIFWTREVWDRCGPLDADEPLMLDYDLFCRFSRQYGFHRVDQIWANYRLHTHSKTSSVTDEQRLDQAVAVSRRYWGTPRQWQYWRILGSYAAFRLNRRVRASGLLRAGRDQYRAGHRLGGLCRLAAGAALGPDVLTDVVLLPAVRPVLSRVRGRSATARRQVRPHTEAWFGHHVLHHDGWAGPTVIIGLDVERTPASLRLSGTATPGRLPSPLELEAFLDGQPLGRRRVGQESPFSLTWDLVVASTGRHEVRIVANTFLVPHDDFGNRDYRPLSYCLTGLEFVDGLGASCSVRLDGTHESSRAV